MATLYLAQQTKLSWETWRTPVLVSVLALDFLMLLIVLVLIIIENCIIINWLLVTKRYFQSNR